MKQFARTLPRPDVFSRLIDDSTKFRIPRGARIIQAPSGLDTIRSDAPAPILPIQSSRSCPAPKPNLVFTTASFEKVRKFNVLPAGIASRADIAFDTPAMPPRPLRFPLIHKAESDYVTALPSFDHIPTKDDISRAHRTYRILEQLNLKLMTPKKIPEHSVDIYADLPSVLH
jgi:hypothetical protein